MGHTRKRNYDRYTLAYKLQAVKLADLLKKWQRYLAEQYQSDILELACYQGLESVGCYVLHDLEFQAAAAVAGRAAFRKTTRCAQE